MRRQKTSRAFRITGNGMRAGAKKKFDSQLLCHRHPQQKGYPVHPVNPKVAAAGGEILGDCDHPL